MALRSCSAVVLAGALVLLAGCGDREAGVQARAQAQAAASEREAEAAEREFMAALDAQNWSLAKAHADVVAMRWPGTEAADRVAARAGEVREKADVAREQARLAALWSYNVLDVKGGEQRSALIRARNDIDTDGSGAREVQLVFRDHPDWGRSSYLVLKAGDFAQACYSSCQVTVTVDDGEPRRMAANRPKTDEAIAMFIEDEKALWQQAMAAGALAIEFPVKAGGTRTAVFETRGVDPSRLPEWPQE